MRAVAALRCVPKSRPKELRWSIYGVVAGVLVGASLGGIGVAIHGGAFGFPAAVVLGTIGGVIGNRIGLEKDRAVWGK
ncbi:hypothetical protein [Bradyrhizobium symbiodeficiens]|uniref:Uncharacterized protein n=1 Tax=Bradyrhizobium symbiodeficiens TaxID=1404367 RepID=A0A6G8ZZF9_9BRAD|nr:hypothetical protein [Bradyrhizobium symbiodeficiens]QIP05612.1 hypothetical protein HAV00_04815 [Bradyrhizobium symbiodeficiens]